ncbi:MAG TPA: phospholipid carrier-dependent glycosyltransferase, partial [Abditibacteriaceae bacterium]
ELRAPHSLTEYFHTAVAPLNPFNKKDVGLFVYGQLPLSITKAIASVRGLDNYDGLLGLGRFLSALADTLAVVLVFLIGRRIGGKQLGLLAAALVSLTALHLQQSHFFTVDTFATFFLVATFWAALRWSSREDKETKRPVLGAAALAGLFFGAALASKISSGLFLLVLFGFAIVRLRRAGWKRAAVELFLCLFTAFWTFRIAHPMAFSGTGGASTLWGLLDIRLFTPEPGGKGFWQSVTEQRGISAGDIDLPWNIQWIGTPKYIFPLRNLLGWGTGWPFGLVSLLALCWIFGCTLRRMVKRGGRDNKAPAALILAALWCLLVFIYFGGQFSKFTRYYLVATPFMALCAAWFLLRLQNTRWKNPARFGTGFVLAATLFWALAVTSIWTRPHTRIAASNWIRATIASGTPVANETSWDDTLPIGETNGLTMLNLELYEPDTDFKRTTLLDKLDRSQWIFISSNRAHGSITRLPGRYPLATEFYRALFAGQLGFTPRREFVSRPQLFGVEFRDEGAEESLTVYDHPRVMLFQKTEAYSRAKAEAALPSSLITQTDSRPLSEWRDAGWNPQCAGEKPLPTLPDVSR